MEFPGLLLLLIFPFSGQLFNVACAFAKTGHFARPPRSSWSFDKQVGCPDTWKALENKCYYITRNPPMTYSDAESFCHVSGSFLASIHSKMEQDFLTAYLGESDARGNVWIGLRKRLEGRSFAANYKWDDWDDRTKRDYSNFAPGEPSSKGSLEQCFHVEHAESVAGQWNDHRCDALKGFVCQSARRTGNGDAKSFYFGANECPEGWHSYRDRCYRLVDEIKNWENAEADCQSYGSRLVSVGDSFEEAFVSFLSSYYQLGSTSGSSFWIGLSDLDPKTKGKLTWSDASSLFHTNWDSSFRERSSNSSEPRCAAIRPNKLWEIEDCSAQLPFMCAKDRNRKNQSRSMFHGECPPGWMDFGNKYCYYVEAVDDENFRDAGLECARKAPKAKLAEFLSEDEMRLVLNYLKSDYVDRAFFVGIKAENREFRYVSNETIAAYLPWGEEEPNLVHTEKCVELSVRRFSYNNLRCRDERPYICQTDKDVVEEIELHGHVLAEEPKTEPRGSDDDETKSGGAKTALIVVLATAAIVAFVVTLLYGWHRKKTPGEGAERVRFRNQE